MRGRGIVAGMAFALLLAAVAACSFALGAAGGSGTGVAKRPNIVVVMTDDQDLPSLDVAMPRVRRDLLSSGTSFDDYVVTTPKCCPARASYLTGDYGHNNGVLANRPGYQGLRDPRNTLPVWLDRAGYETAQVGKFLNGYDRERGTRDGRRPAPGFDRWYAMLRPYRYYDYAIARNGHRVEHGTRARDYSTDVLTRYARRFIARSAKRRRPLFLNLAYWAPHSERAQGKRGGACSGDAIPARRDRRAFAGAAAPEPPSLGEPDVSDKPPWIQHLAPIGEAQRRAIDVQYRCRLASLRAVDRGVDEILRELRARGELDDTVFVFTDDNGFFQGEHRITRGKGLPYEEAIRVPLVIRAPRRIATAGAPASSDLPAASIDLAPTLLDLADARPCRARRRCRTIDGRSLAPLLAGDAGAWPADRAIEIESNDASHDPCGYVALRTSGYLYAEFDRVPGTGGVCGPASSRREELYDLASDPFELTNLAPAPALEAALAARLDALRTCSGSAAGAASQAAGNCD